MDNNKKKIADLKLLQDELSIQDLNSPKTPTDERASSLSDVLRKMREKGSSVTNIDSKGALPGSNLLQDVSRTAPKSAAKAGMKTALKGIPLVGGLASALLTGDASAAVPGLDTAEETGAPKNSLQGRFERGEKLSPEEYKAMIDEAKSFAQEQQRELTKEQEAKKLALKNYK